jgi:crossover junction endodeoxyribonuclease RusA
MRKGGVKMILNFPYPPSMNCYWLRARNGGIFISKKGMEFRRSVANIALGEGSFSGTARLKIIVQLFPADKRRRDIDNPIKPLFDAMQHAGIFPDDSQIDWLIVHRMEQVKGGKCVVIIETIWG